MRVTLRFVIGSLCAGVVAVVAAVTLAITISVSLAAVRDLGRKHSSALASEARLLVEGYFGETTRHLEALAAFVGGADGIDIPSALPDQTAEEPKRRVLDAMFVESQIVNHTYDGSSVVFDDGSGCTLFKINGGTAMHGTCRFMHLWPSGLGNQSHMYRNWELPSGRELSPDFYPGAIRTNLDARVASYSSIRTLMTGVPGERGLWFPLTLFIDLGGTPRLIKTAIKPIYNRTGGYVAFGAWARSVYTISDMLRTVRGTPNTQVFALEGTGYLVGSTHSVPFVSTNNVSSASPVPAGCTSSAVGTFGAIPDFVLHGCREHASGFPYPPLQVAAEDVAFRRATDIEVKEIEANGERFFVVSAGVPNPYRSWSLNILLCLPESDILGDIVRGRNLAVGITVAVFVVAAVLSSALVYTLLQPLSDVSRRMRYTAKLRDMEDTKEYSVLAEIQDLQKAYTNMNTAIRSFTRYVPRDVVKDLMASGQLCTIQMTPQMCSMLFVDIAGFTTLCERVPPDVLSDLVSQYFDRASRIVMEHQGLIDKFIGDCIMVVWGAPFPVSNHEVKAALTAVMLNWCTAVGSLAAAWDDAGELLRVRVGVSSGEVLAGNMGSSERMNYTVIGDPVNLAARLESLNKQFGTRVMVSETTAASLRDAFVLRLLMPIAVVGKEQPVKVYELMGLSTILSADDRDAFDAADADAVDDSGSDVGSVMSSASMRSHHDASRVYRENARSTVTMLQDAIRSALGTPVAIECTPEEADFARKHTHAVAAYMRGNFAGAVTDLLELNNHPAAAASDGAAVSLWQPERSVQLVRELCEKYLREGAPTGFDGVYRALEK